MPDQKDDDDSAASRDRAGSAEKSRWWDHYYVRYFVGSVFAVPLMLALSKKEAVKDLIGTVDQTKILDATVLAAAGLAFCYVASAPILLLHATRCARNAAKDARGSRDMSSVLFGALAILFTVVVGSWIAYDFTWPAILPAELCFAPLALVMVAQAMWILRTPVSAIIEFYRGLGVERAHRPDSALGRKRREYIQSYRDMREHGNALLILVMEGVLTTALLQADSTAMLFAMLILWVMPASFVWFIATALEAHLPDVK
jgi:hypothetical protein